MWSCSGRQIVPSETTKQTRPGDGLCRRQTPQESQQRHKGRRAFECLKLPPRSVAHQLVSTKPLNLGAQGGKRKPAPTRTAQRDIPPSRCPRATAVDKRRGCFTLSQDVDGQFEFIYLAGPLQNAALVLYRKFVPSLTGDPFSIESTDKTETGCRGGPSSRQKKTRGQWHPGITLR